MAFGNLANVLQIFLVDNAETMMNNWWEATFLLETLVIKAKGQDENGMDLFFTIGKEAVKSSNQPSAFKSAMEKARPETGMHTDIRKKLDSILDDYLRMAKRNSRLNQKIRNLTMIILTDGIWAGTEDKDSVRRIFKKFIGDLTELLGDQENRRVSIQFVQFGKDLDATHRLRSLDVDLEWDGIP